MIAGGPLEWLQRHGFQVLATASWVWVWRLDAASRIPDVRRFTSVHRAARVLQAERAAAEGKVA